jgi:hypothetical protein
MNDGRLPAGYRQPAVLKPRLEERRLAEMFPEESGIKYAASS